ncbi:Ldh family oxidoreductase [Mesorhizobium sp. 131-2-1]|uniref:Ldh family oxidoreductase n=1 Tax=Mesorhizobium sp. 131-2-1 TaxID=2744518 RepID=UPI0018EBC2B8|nr:Ldh family oxidoreductase [Mesorhizobium sp. 131-2-1]BCG97820.1 dehydrogenase [Mesorhizobium sp. 131-2-1]
MTTTSLSLDEVEERAFAALSACGASQIAASSLARAVAAAEAEGIASHGLLYVPTYCEHLGCGKVVRDAVPMLSKTKPSTLVVDAGSGFAHPAIDMGFESLIPLAHEMGIAALAVRNSYNCGVLGYHTDRLAGAGLLAMGFTHAPASIAPVGGRRPVIGTNPFAIAAPGANGSVVISIDQSASVIAKSEIIKRKRDGRGIPPNWAFGPDGEPTTDADLALKGTMAPSGGYKGFGVGLLVELLASAAAGALPSTEASPFSGPVGEPPRTGQFFIAIDAGATSGGIFADRIATLVEAIVGQDGARLPGKRRVAQRAKAEREGVTVPTELLERIARISSGN